MMTLYLLSATVIVGVRVASVLHHKTLCINVRYCTLVMGCVALHNHNCNLFGVGTDSLEL